ncbi:MAG TPA: phage major capsid protein [Candidatus Binatus sp.]|nr:phage major capsid protein [Candidatus Binatus sp.]
MSAAIHKEVTSLAAEVTGVAKSIGEYKQENADLKSRLEKLEKEMAKPAFSAAKSLHAEPIDHKLKKSFGFETPREFLFSVMNACSNQNQDFDPRLTELYAINLDRKAKSKSLVTKTVGSDEARGISDPYGGFLVPTTFIPDILKIDPEADPIGGRTRNIPMATPSIKIPARSDKDHTTSVAGGVTVTRRPETVAATASQMTMEQVTLDAKTLMGLSYATEEILTDSPISFAALLSAGFNDQFVYHLIKERLYGTGIGEFLGILSALDSNSTGPTVSIAKESGQAADTIIFTNVVKMRAQCWGYDKAVWLANHDCYPQLSQLSLPIGIAGTAMYTPSLQDDRPDRLLGRPIFYTEYAKTVGDQGDLILANWNEYLEGTYQPMQNAESVHVRFVTHERAFKFWTRNAGAPWWRVPITPVYSSSKLSPFVVLDAR